LRVLAYAWFHYELWAHSSLRSSSFDGELHVVCGLV
jgi:hypothetical protein